MSYSQIRMYGVVMMPDGGPEYLYSLHASQTDAEEYLETCQRLSARHFRGVTVDIPRYFNDDRMRVNGLQ